MESIPLAGKCTVCADSLSAESVHMIGMIGAVTIRFCAVCFDGLYDMFNTIRQEQSEEAGECAE